MSTQTTAFNTSNKSSSLTPEMEELITKAEHALTFRYLIVALGVILFYDFLLTLSREVEHLWYRKRNLVSIFRITVRLLSILDNVLRFVLIFSPFHSISDCRSWINVVVWTSLCEHIAAERMPTILRIKQVLIMLSTIMK